MQEKFTCANPGITLDMAKQGVRPFGQILTSLNFVQSKWIG